MTTFNVESLPLPIVHSDFKLLAADIEMAKKSRDQERALIDHFMKSLGIPARLFLTDDNGDPK